MTNKHFGTRIKRITETGLTKREKISIYGFVLVMLTPVFILTDSPHLRIFLVVLMAVKAIFFFRMKTAPRPISEKAGEQGAEVYRPDLEDSVGE
jgi:uncharacterized membrane protein YbaN (DUF454 family)